jgi:methionine biosynthesis protein MetW
MANDVEPVRGLSVSPVSELRYNCSSDNPYESPGLLMSMIPAGSRVLDIGCGTGSISQMVRDACSADIVGIEPNSARAKVARESGLEVVCGYYDESFAREHGQFDVIMLADVLEHLVDPLDMLEKIKSSLSHDGRVVASIPNVAHWSVRLKLLAGVFNYKPSGIMDATHLRWFTRRSVLRLFHEAGYEVEQMHGAPGAWIGEYRWTPLRIFSYQTRSLILSKICNVLPGLFSVQHVIRARLR